jgi:cell division protein FtsL
MVKRTTTKAKSRRGPVSAKPASRSWYFGFVLTLGAIALSGIAVVSGAHDMRTLYQQLGEVQREQDALLADHSRLMLERSARSSLQSIEEAARGELGMEFPVAGQVIVE